jgi:hypothetical protein
MNLAWTSGHFVGPKHHRSDLAGYPIIGRWVPMAHRFGGSPSSSASPATAPGSRTGSEGGYVIAHGGGVAVEETLLPLVSGLAGRRTRAQWCWMTTTWV